jgi:hypothetical protein
VTTAGPAVPEHTVLHQFPDRVRCRAPRVASDAAYSRRLTAAAGRDECVSSVRINRLVEILTRAVASAG